MTTLEGAERHELATLRTTEPNWWERMFPYSHAYCPLCHCNKSGYATEPNQQTDACQDEACPCHEETTNA